MCWWSSIIPTKMYKKWVSRKWIPDGANHFVSAGKGKHSRYEEILEKDGARKLIPSSASKKKRLLIQGWHSVTKRYAVSEKRYGNMCNEVNSWYEKVFAYINNWLRYNRYIKLQKGSFNGGFCAELNPEADTVKNWNAPLADKGNKVTQIKEKHGYFTVYLDNLSKKEQKEIKEFAKRVEEKYDCKTMFN